MTENSETMCVPVEIEELLAVALHLFAVDLSVEICEDGGAAFRGRGPGWDGGGGGFLNGWFRWLDCKQGAHDRGGLVGETHIAFEHVEGVT